MAALGIGTGTQSMGDEAATKTAALLSQCRVTWYHHDTACEPYSAVPDRWPTVQQFSAYIFLNVREQCWATNCTMLSWFLIQHIDCLPSFSLFSATARGTYSVTGQMPEPLHGALWVPEDGEMLIMWQISL
eukprot:g33017.t1